MTKNTYKTQAASFDGEDLVFYCYSDKHSLEEFLEVQDKAFTIAIIKRYSLFKKYYSLKNDQLVTVVGFN